MNSGLTLGMVPTQQNLNEAMQEASTREKRVPQTYHTAFVPLASVMSLQSTTVLASLTPNVKVRYTNRGENQNKTPHTSLPSHSLILCFFHPC